MGLALLLVYLKTKALRTGDDRYNRSAQFWAHTDAHSSLRQFPVEFLRLLITVVQSPFTAFPGFGIYKRDVRITRVVIYAYNQPSRLLSPEPLVSTNHSLLGSKEPALS